MPKRKQTLEPRMDSRSRRAASKVALIQMQKLSSESYVDEPETLEILSDDDDVIPVEPPPKKKYKLTHKKSSDGHDRDVIVLKTITSFNSYKVDEDTLNLDCWPEELSSAQLLRQKNIKKEWADLNKELDHYVKHKMSQLIYSSDSYTVYDVSTPNSHQVGESSTFTQPVPVSRPVPSSILPSMKASASSGVKLVMDVSSGLLLGTMMPTSLLSTPVTTAAIQASSTRSASPKTKTKKPVTGVVSKLIKVAGTDNIKQKEVQSTAAVSSSRNPRENVVDLTQEDANRSAADSREVTFNKTQGKTFPSLVVVARPLLNVSSFNANRTTLDTRVKTVLMYPPTKFTEWLIQQGLLRSEQTCSAHPETKLKLGIYSDATKFTVSGGYVWVADCCPSKFISVFKGSIFEGTSYSSVIMLKLIYHWACQTLVQNVIQWVKVDNLYLKGMYTLLRSVCTIALHTHIPKLGGTGVKVEVGVISLGTTSHDGNQRQVKVEVLGVLETVSRRIRLRAVEPLDDTDRNYKRRFMKILEPLINWVHPESYIITDLTVDKHTLLSMGFKYVHQASSSDPSSNNVIMEYLRKVVPRMFQNTLSLLSRHIIQQFLDELVWREWYGSTANAAFDNIIAHIAEQTKVNQGASLLVRLNKVSVNPFKNWNIKQTRLTFKPPSTTPSTSSVNVLSTKVVSLPINKLKQYGKKKLSEEPTLIDKNLKPNTVRYVSLENFYYGSLAGDHYVADFYPHEIKCTVCNKKTCKNNIEMMEHVFNHALNTTPAGRPLQCRYCLSSFKQSEMLNSHIKISHPIETQLGVMYSCLICSYKAKSHIALGKHMNSHHVRSELPYKCETCGFRTSTHRDIINHFYKIHSGGSQLQCPFCLKTVSIEKQRRNPCGNVFMHHIVKHLKKGAYTKCSKCMLTFINKNEYTEHVMNMHASLKGKQGLVKRIPVNGNVCLIPMRKLSEEEEADLKSLVIDIDTHLKCIECQEKLTSPLHFPSIQSCSNNCQYTTCCKKAMKNHKCKQLNAALPNCPLPFKMYCICGYSESDGNAIAKHLAVCERKSAYPSLESAQAATVTHSMLDVLGLVRRPEEPTTSSAVDTATTLNSTQSKTKTTIVDNDIEIIESDDNLSVDTATMQHVMNIIDKHTQDAEENDQGNVKDKISKVEEPTDKTQSSDIEKIADNIEVIDDAMEQDKSETVGDGDNTEKQNDNVVEDENKLTEPEENNTSEENNMSEENNTSEELSKEEQNIASVQIETSEEQNNALEANDDALKTKHNATTENNSLTEDDALKADDGSLEGVANTLQQKDAGNKTDKNNGEVEQASSENTDHSEILSTNEGAIETNEDCEKLNDNVVDEIGKDTENVTKCDKETSELVTNMQNCIEEMEVENNDTELNETQNISEETIMDVDDTPIVESNTWNNIDDTPQIPELCGDIKDNFMENNVDKSKDFIENDDISKEYEIDDSGLIGNDKLLEF